MHAKCLFLVLFCFVFLSQPAYGSVTADMEKSYGAIKLILSSWFFFQLQPSSFQLLTRRTYS